MGAPGSTSSAAGTRRSSTCTASQIEQDTRYDHGLEWYQVWSRMLEGGPEFDWDGRFFKLRRLETNPVSVQRPRPLVMSAGFSPKGRDFAAQAADALFTTMTELDQAPAMLANVAAACGQIRQAAAGLRDGSRGVPADPQGSGGVLPLLRGGARRRGGPSLLSPPARHDDRHRARRRCLVRSRSRFTRATGKSFFGAYPGTYPFVGTPDDVASEMARMSAAGLAGTSVAFLDYLKEIPYFVAGGAAAPGSARD